MRNTECSFTVNSSRTVVQKQMNSYETKILFSCKYPSVIKYQGNKNDRKMYDVQAELFPKQCIFHEASIALSTAAHVSNKVQSTIRLCMSSAMEKALILLLVLLLSFSSVQSGLLPSCIETRKSLVLVQGRRERLLGSTWKAKSPDPSFERCPNPDYLRFTYSVPSGPRCKCGRRLCFRQLYPLTSEHNGENGSCMSHIFSADLAYPLSAVISQRTVTASPSQPQIRASTIPRPGHYPSPLFFSFYTY